MPLILEAQTIIKNFKFKAYAVTQWEADATNFPF